ncbi:Creatinine amidohydrolase [Paenibacillus konkukensis]|uniref:Creatinine amidohydrolase n=1 Tax=Paenibacillus konkukensis TaxID=2020716 RepID=A0ABY4RWK2_9BACL|nr:creatininase family protein [Paenibacillus konkukensis]UQZ86363.1 Creatinine amidohydrolase [Paenibacillus konkukensis]
MKPNIGPKVLWSELLPYEFRARLAECPTVYLPLGICEPHGQVSAFGLDTFKAEWLCIEAARRTGGIVAPSMGYHIHEAGYHARWLEEEVGETDPLLTGIPPAVMIHLLLYQLRSFVNAGFRTIVVVSGHSGGNQADLRQAAAAFTEHVPVTVWVRSDPELADGLYTGDHAGKYELSQLMYLRPELVDMEARAWGNVPGSGGKMALGDDADEATPELGQSIMNACLDRLCAAVCSLNKAQHSKTIPPLTYGIIEEIWRRVLSGSETWVTARPWPNQKPVSAHSRWKTYECYRADR